MPDRRVEEYAGGADFAWVSNALSERRDEILERWLDAAASQPFHDGRREHAVADHIPHLFDALLGSELHRQKIGFHDFLNTWRAKSFPILGPNWRHIKG